MYSIPQSAILSHGDKHDAELFLSEQTEKIVLSQLEASRKITQNQDLNTARISVGFDNAAIRIANNNDENTDKIIGGISQIYGGIADLGALFNWKLTEMIWILEQQRNEFKKITEIFQKPRATEARELKERADDAYRNRLIPEAIEDFKESIKLNRYDFTNYQSLGNIYLFNQKEPETALEYYHLAARYAEPRSNYYACFAYLHAGFADYLLGRYKDAYDAATRAIQLYPKFIESYYQRAKYGARLCNFDKAVNDLRIAIEHDRIFCMKAVSEKDFEPMSCQLRSLIENLRDESIKNARTEINDANNLFEKLNGFLPGIDVDPKCKLNEGISLMEKGDYFNVRDAIYKIITAKRIALDLFINASLKNKSDLEKEIKDLEEKIKKSRVKLISQYGKNIPTDTVYMRLTITLIIAAAIIYFAYANSLALVIDPSFQNGVIAFGLIWLLAACNDLYRFHKSYSGRLKDREKIKAIEAKLSDIKYSICDAESELSQLKLNRCAQKLNAEQYETYLRRTYG